MRVWYRILAAFLALLLLCVCIGVACVMLKIPYSIDLNGTADAILESRTGLWVTAVSLPILALLCGLVIFVRATKKVPPPPTTALIQTTDIGSMVITLAALEGMAQRHIRATPRIKEGETQLELVPEGGIRISIKLSVLPDTPLVELCEGLQQSLKAYIQDHSGVAVQDVSLMVANAGALPAPTPPTVV
ncbi:MAG: alkaline shock response membrane anchor protein AmaP [Clostridiales bacterium]|nr:alkaline shock response membrane anchor protein AmaP [Clostridiales bacterium]